MKGETTEGEKGRGLLDKQALYNFLGALDFRFVS